MRPKTEMTKCAQCGLFHDGPHLGRRSFLFLGFGALVATQLPEIVVPQNWRLSTPIDLSRWAETPFKLANEHIDSILTGGVDIPGLKVFRTQIDGLWDDVWSGIPK